MLFRQETDEWDIKAILSKEYNIPADVVDKMPLPAIGSLLAQLGDRRSKQAMDEAMMKAKLQGMGV